jgi:hypothetical protein
MIGFNRNMHVAAVTHEVLLEAGVFMVSVKLLLID